MIATFAIEIGLLFYTLWRYKLTPITRLTSLIFVFLATFQLAEYMVCEGPIAGALSWSRVGFVAITMLPPLGLHLAYTIAGAKRKLLLWPAYIAAAGFAAFFLFVGHSFVGHICAGNYVIFDVAEGSGLLYGLYYYGLLIAGLWVSRQALRTQKSKKIRRALTGLMIGYAVFIVPTAAVNLVNRNTVDAIPSIMCGFAVLLALLLAFVVIPATVRKR